MTQALYWLCRYLLQWIIAFLAGAFCAHLNMADENVAYWIVLIVASTAFYAIDCWRRARP